MRFWRVFLSLVRTYQWREVAPWLPADSESLSSYLASIPGRRLVQRLRNRSIEHNASAVQSGDRWDCGQASGYMLALADLYSLSVNGEPESPENEDLPREGVEEFLARMAP